ncbi:DUF2066 domain-containing protein [Shewanella sp. D64]|uniref:DUF2066 domain-containing protein n=1 Tax=unclassified Shewanella TaxID=196818 RepID=UPI0022BA66D0|nr:MULTISPECIES: DUF2066 domain-containing protein [unclassified Shewanella]MEC4724237.1 DUF2066 domain-containing protein [Shewanella sp. D64]MEC4736257.1 DUF2066 domain-containing protein [Shewanella sp. E94]WBJ97811.1 DUF2066 domain-containing protein [Shewanella sp. MTB7]
MLKTLFKASILYASCLLIQLNSVNAAEVTVLDESLVPVETRSTAERNKAISLALQNVILKNSGAKSALTNPIVMAKVKSPNTLISQYGYHDIDGELFLRVNFDHRRILKLLRDAQLPVWGKQRPLTLIWLVEDLDGERSILNDASLRDTRHSFKLEAEAKGVPLLFPLMDLDDNMQISVNDVRGMFVTQVDQASLRYQSDYFAVASMSPNVNGVEYSVSLFAKGAGQQGMMTPLVSQRQEAVDVNAAVKGIISVVSEYYVSRYAIADTGAQLNSSITFIDISEMKQLVEIEKYLKQLSAVKSVNVTQMLGSSVKYNLELFGTLDELHRLMALDPRVLETESRIRGDMNSNENVMDPTTVLDQELEYRWLG